MHRRVVFRANDHQCSTFTRDYLFAPHEAMILAVRGLWLFCPWCGEQLADLVECGQEYTREVHIATIPYSKGVCHGDYITVNCGMDLRIEKLSYSDSINYLPLYDTKLCQECVFQRQRLPRHPVGGGRDDLRVQVRGK